ncbi:MAG: family phosphatase [Clostridia bacterium]|jgi:Cof subfamily protein (haloacid dehalogenase superfamily)|nr:family phosphatase [Clostridia bacterium]
MLKYKMLVTDMDYTLLNKDKNVSEGNKKALKAAIDKGVHVVVATGRIYTSALYYARLLGISTPIIASNGAIIREEHTDNTLYQCLLSEAAIKEMIRLTREKGLFCHFFGKDTIYTEKLVNVSTRYIEWNKYMAEKDQVKIRLLDRFEDMTECEKREIFKAVVVDDDNSKLQYIREEILKTDIVTVSQSLSDNIEVMHKEVSKGNAVAKLAEIYHIDRAEIITLGDNENDISMIEYAGLGVAMGNAVQLLKDRADYITADYMEDGVAQVIEKFIL